MVEIESKIRASGNSYVLYIPAALVKCKVIDPTKRIRAILTEVPDQNALNEQLSRNAHLADFAELRNFSEELAINLNMGLPTHYLEGGGGDALCGFRH